MKTKYICVILTIMITTWSCINSYQSTSDNITIPSTSTSQPTLIQSTETFVPLPTSTEIKLNIGDSISEFFVDKPYFSLTVLAWRESQKAVDGPYVNEIYYTFLAQPGMKFIVIDYELKNDGVRPHYGPIFSNGEIVTNKGYYYPMWNPLGGVHSDEYSPRPSTESEINLFIRTNKRVYDEILPEEIVSGYWAYEIPDDQIPVEAIVFGVPHGIVLEGD